MSLCGFLFLCELCVCVSQRETRFHIPVEVFSAFKPAVQKLFSRHPQLITLALCVSFYQFLSQLVKNNMIWHAFHTHPNWTEPRCTEPYWRERAMDVITAGYLDILNRLNVLNGPFLCLIDVDKGCLCQSQCKCSAKKTAWAMRRRLK